MDEAIDVEKDTVRFVALSCVEWCSPIQTSF